jgi:hypothetical protein
MVYQAAYVAALAVTGSERQRRCRAKALATKAEGSAQRYAPAAFALLVNTLILFGLGSIAIRTNPPPDPDVLTATLDTEGFFAKTVVPDPPGGGGGGGQAIDAALAQAIAVPTVNVAIPTDVLTAVTTTAPAVFEVPTMVSSVTDLAAKAMDSKPAGATGGSQGNSNGTGTGTGSGQGTGSGTGIGNGHGAGQGGTVGTGKGYGGSKITDLSGWNLLVAIDRSNMVGDGGGYAPGLSINHKSTSGSVTGVAQVKVNTLFIPNILAQKNYLVEVVNTYDDRLVEPSVITKFREKGFNEESDTVTNDKFFDLQRALEYLNDEYAGRANTAIVLASEFQWTAKDYDKAGMDKIRALFLQSKLPVFLLSHGARPDPKLIKLAVETGGGYLGFVNASAAKRMAKNEDEAWIYKGFPDGPLYYDRGSLEMCPPQPGGNREILSGLGESSISPEEAQSATERALQQQQ